MGEGHHIHPDAVAALSPYITQHVIRFGLYHVDQHRQPEPLIYEVLIPDRDDVPQETSEVGSAG